MMDTNREIGLGCDDYSIAVYIANRPPLGEYLSLNELTAVSPDEIYTIGQQCGNGWRKIFNVYAKLLYALDRQLFSFASLAPTWQQFRDAYLLQPDSDTALLFSAPRLFNPLAPSPLAPDHKPQAVHVIMGRTYARALVNSGLLDVPLTWLDHEFAINAASRVIVCPYFDYRQLSNLKIDRLATLIKELKFKEL